MTPATIKAIWHVMGIEERIAILAVLLCCITSTILAVLYMFAVMASPMPAICVGLAGMAASLIGVFTYGRRR